jgi:beta-N-acetylhexosaminidase
MWSGWTRLLAAVLVALAVGTVSQPAYAVVAPEVMNAREVTAAPRAALGGACPARVRAGMTLRQRVGQLFVAGVSSTSPSRAEVAVIRDSHLGGVILTGRSTLGVTATRRITSRLQAQVGPASTASVRLWVSVDQEGGYVQVLQGPGFSAIPTALTQGQWRVPVLQHRAYRWGRQLQAAGVNLDLAPVLDTVPASLGTRNQPIGYYYREYGHRPRIVARHGLAVRRGLASAGPQSTAKHFPGLGRVLHNTDTNAHVTDRVTTRHDPYLLPFQRAIDDQIPVVMVSSARYTRIDRNHIGPFSSTIMRGMLRGDLGFRGVIMSDDLGAAAAVASYPPAVRAVRFVRAGGTVVLTVVSSTVGPMAGGVLAQARAHRRFRRQVNADVLTVLRAKNRAGLLPC